MYAGRQIERPPSHIVTGELKLLKPTRRHLQFCASCGGDMWERAPETHACIQTSCLAVWRDILCAFSPKRSLVHFYDLDYVLIKRSLKEQWSMTEVHGWPRLARGTYSLGQKFAHGCPSHSENLGYHSLDSTTQGCADRASLKEKKHIR